jgi:hypothetical protein
MIISCSQLTLCSMYENNGKCPYSILADWLGIEYGSCITLLCNLVFDLGSPEWIDVYVKFLIHCHAYAIDEQIFFVCIQSAAF